MPGRRTRRRLGGVDDVGEEHGRLREDNSVVGVDYVDVAGCVLGDGVRH